MYKRVLLKLSGESLGGSVGKGLDPESLRKYSKEIAQAAKAGLQIAIVNGGATYSEVFRVLTRDSTASRETGWECWLR